MQYCSISKVTVDRPRWIAVRIQPETATHQVRIKKKKNCCFSKGEKQKLNIGYKNQQKLDTAIWRTPSYRPHTGWFKSTKAWWRMCVKTFWRVCVCVRFPFTWQILKSECWTDRQVDNSLGRDNTQRTGSVVNSRLLEEKSIKVCLSPRSFFFFFFLFLDFIKTLFLSDICR